MTFDSLYKVGPVSYTIRELMKQVVSANTLTEAHDKAYWIQKALLDDYNQEISDKLNEVLNTYHEEPNFSIVQTRYGDGVEAPPFLTNDIFVTELESSPWEKPYIYIDMDKLWCWIYHNFVRKLKAKYEWLSLFLFAKGHGLIPNEINAKKFCTQMKRWYGTEYTTDDPSYYQVNCYQAGYFSNRNFNYSTWVRNKYPLPNSSDFRKGQKKEGFERILELCVTLEANFSINLIQVIERNR